MPGEEKEDDGLVGEMEELRASSARLRQAEAEKEEAERALRESERKYRELVENLNDVLYAVDAEGTVTYVSPSVRTVLGYEPRDVIGRPFEELVFSDDLEKIRTNHRRIMHEGPSRPNEYRFLTKSGEVRWGLVSSRQLFSNARVAGLQGILTDVTELRIAEEKVRESERWYRTVVEDLPVLVCCFDSEGTITFVNEAYCEYFGKAREELVGTSFMKLIPEGDREFVEAKFSALTPENPVDTYEHKVIDSDGAIRWQRWTDRAIFDGDGAFLGYKSIGQDITEQRNLEERLRQSEKLEAIGQLAGGIAHDFNNQLTAILGGAEMLRLRLGAGDQALRRAVDMIIRASRRSSEMANKLLAFARKGRLKSVIIDIHQLINEVMELLQAGLRRDVEIRTDFRADPCVTRGDPTQIQSVLLNIALNARDAMPEGGVLTISTGNVTPPADMAMDAVGGGNRRCICVCVSDTGVGMDAETKSRVFEPFFTTKPEGAGTGMGLAAAYGAVKAHGGEIEVESEPGRGATFRVYLPVNDTSREPASDVSILRVRSRRRIMMVDDDDEVRDATCGMLKAVGHEALSFATGEEAISHFRENHNKTDLVILDMLMPDMSGAETFRELRRIDPEAKIVLCTGYSADGSAGFEGAAGVLTKPFDMTVLAETIEKALQEPEADAS